MKYPDLVQDFKKKLLECLEYTVLTFGYERPEGMDVETGKRLGHDGIVHAACKLFENSLIAQIKHRVPEFDASDEVGVRTSVSDIFTTLQVELLKEVTKRHG
ncbi:hypothetical protein [Glutamicibacter sp.]|jgi:hypothetical protein|uniref:hypothetical protein n=1 Tax=Glutamicibacter sp. TaxID=1931995 RepID=UPI002FDA2BB0